MIWYSHLFKNFSECVVIHKIKAFHIVNEAKVDVFLEFPWFLCVPTNVGNLISGESKVQCCKEQYCIGTWSVRPINQGKVDMVRQEMARVNIDILGISELKWTGMGDFNSDDLYIYYCSQESLRRNGVALIVNRKVWNAVLGVQSQKWQNDLSSFPRQAIQYCSNPSLCSNHWCQKAEVDLFYEDLQLLLELTPKTMSFSP